MRTRVCLIVVLVLSVSCASVPLKQKVSASHQTIRTAITAFDDAERALCQPAPAPNSNHCTSPTAASIGLTDAKHQAVSRALVDAYDKDNKVGAAIILWKAGDPVPTDLPTLLADANAALAAVQPIAPSSGLLAKAQDFLKKVQDLLTLIGGGK